jgi:hypothetical protein
VAVPFVPGGLPEGQLNPPDLPGPVPPIAPSEDTVGKSQGFTHTSPGIISPAQSNPDPENASRTPNENEAHY